MARVDRPASQILASQRYAIRQRWARVVPQLAWKRPGIPGEWVRVLEQHPEGVATLPGHVWLDMPGKVRHVPEDWLEFTDEP